VTRQDVARLHSSMKGTPYQANRCLALVSAIFSFAELMGERPQASNPARGVERFREEARERLLSPFELGCIGQALREAERLADDENAALAALYAARERLAVARAAGDRKAGGSAFRDVEAARERRRALVGRAVPAQMIAFVRLLLFTGARSSEILTLLWDWVDFERAEARLPDSKTGRKTVHLPAPALEVLAGLPRVAGNPYVIFGDGGEGHFVGVQKPWLQIRNAATVAAWAGSEDPEAAIVAQLRATLGRPPTIAECRQAADVAGVALTAWLEGLRLHDLRHAFASVAAGSGLGLPIIGKLLGRAQPATTQRYAHLAAAR
jgi:integrase